MLVLPPADMVKYVGGRGTLGASPFLSWSSWLSIKCIPYPSPTKHLGGRRHSRRTCANKGEQDGKNSASIPSHLTMKDYLKSTGGQLPMHLWQQQSPTKAKGKLMPDESLEKEQHVATMHLQYTTQLLDPKGITPGIKQHYCPHSSSFSC